MPGSVPRMVEAREDQKRVQQDGFTLSPWRSLGHSAAVREQVTQRPNATRNLERFCRGVKRLSASKHANTVNKGLSPTQHGLYSPKGKLVRPTEAQWATSMRSLGQGQIMTERLPHQRSGGEAAQPGGRRTKPNSSKSPCASRTISLARRKTTRGNAGELSVQT